LPRSIYGEGVVLWRQRWTIADRLLTRSGRTVAEVKLVARFFDVGQLASCGGWHLLHVDAPPPKPFRLVSHEEFAKFSREQKIAYLTMAIEAVKENAPLIGFNHYSAERADGVR
jgi:hypothetical protein